MCNDESIPSPVSSVDSNNPNGHQEVPEHINRHGAQTGDGIYYRSIQSTIKIEPFEEEHSSSPGNCFQTIAENSSLLSSNLKRESPTHESCFDRLSLAAFDQLPGIQYNKGLE